MRYQHLVSHFGSLTAAARKLKKPKQTIWNWKSAGIPEIDQLEIQKFTDGALPADRKVVARFRELLGVA